MDRCANVCLGVCMVVTMGVVLFMFAAFYSPIYLGNIKGIEESKFDSQERK